MGCQLENWLARSSEEDVCSVTPVPLFKKNLLRGDHVPMFYVPRIPAVYTAKLYSHGMDIPVGGKKIKKKDIQGKRVRRWGLYGSQRSVSGKLPFKQNEAFEYLGVK